MSKTGTMPFRCDPCGAAFTAKRSLVRHINSMHKNSKFTCAECGRIFARVDNLRHHFKVKHEAFYEPYQRRVRMNKEIASNQSNDDDVYVHNNTLHNEVHNQLNYEFLPNKADDEEENIVKSEYSANYNMQEDPVDCIEMEHVLEKTDKDKEQGEHELKIKLESESDNEDCILIHSDQEMQSPNIDESNHHEEVTESTHQCTCPSNRNDSLKEDIDFTVLDILQQSASDAKDEDRMFFLSVLSDFKRIPELKKIKVKAKILSAIAEELE